MASIKNREKRARSERPREDQLVSIAAELFARQGYDGTSLREIADAAGITKAALYYWFPEKERLFERVVGGRLSILMDRANEAVNRGRDPIEKIRLFMLGSVEQMEKDRYAWAASSNAFWTNFKADQRKSVVPVRDQFERLLRQCIADAIDQGLLRDADPAMATRLLLSGLNFMPRWHKQGGPISAVQVMEQYLDIVLEGLRKR